MSRRREKKREEIFSLIVIGWVVLATRVLIHPHHIIAAFRLDEMATVNIYLQFFSGTNVKIIIDLLSVLHFHAHLSSFSGYDFIDKNNVSRFVVRSAIIFTIHRN